MKKLKAYNQKYYIVRNDRVLTYWVPGPGPTSITDGIVFFKKANIVMFDTLYLRKYWRSQNSLYNLLTNLFCTFQIGKDPMSGIDILIRIT